MFVVESLLTRNNRGLTIKYSPKPLQLFGGSLTTGTGSTGLFNPLKLVESLQPERNKNLKTITRTPTLSNPLQLPNPLQASTRILQNLNPVLPKFVTNTFKRITNVFKELTTTSTLFDTAARLFGLHNMDKVKEHSKVLKPILQILMLLLRSLQKYVETADRKEMSDVLGKIINVLDELIHQQQ